MRIWPSDAKPARTFSATYSRPFSAHASIGPSCSLAQWKGHKSVTVWTHSQGVYNLRADLALALGLAPEAVEVRHVEGAGCYGHNPADDVALDAALLARAADERPVRVLWAREDELGWAPYSTRPGRADKPALLAAGHLEKPFEMPLAINPPMPAGGSERNAVPLYDFPGRRVVCHLTS